MGLFSKIKKVVKIGGAIASGNPLKIAGAAASLFGGGSGKKSAKKAAAAEAEAYARSEAEYRNALLRAEQYQQPFREAGTAALGGLTKLNAGDYSAFSSSPDYQFAVEQGGRAVDRSAAARGNLNSGNTLIAQQRFGQGLASQQLGAYRNALFQQAGMGQSAANAITGATLDTSGRVGNAMVGQGDARASGIVGGANAMASGIEGAAGFLTGIKLPAKKPKNALMALNYRGGTPSVRSAV